MGEKIGIFMGCEVVVVLWRVLLRSVKLLWGGRIGEYCGVLSVLEES